MNTVIQRVKYFIDDNIVIHTNKSLSFKKTMVTFGDFNVTTSCNICVTPQDGQIEQNLYILMI
jgi:hypothetical protein